MEKKEALRKSKLKPHERENEHIIDQVNQIVDGLAAERKFETEDSDIEQDVLDRHKLAISDILIGQRRIQRMVKKPQVESNIFLAA